MVGGSMFNRIHFSEVFKKSACFPKDSVCAYAEWHLAEMATQINELVDRYDQGVVYCKKNKEKVSKLKAELDHKFEELASQTARVFELEKEKAAAMVEELVKVKAQLANVVSWEQAANQKVKDTCLELKKACQEFSQADTSAKYQKQWADKAEKELQKMAAQRVIDILAAKENVKADLANINDNEMANQIIARTYPYFCRELNHALQCASITGTPLRTLVDWSRMDCFDPILRLAHNVILYFTDELAEIEDLNKQTQSTMLVSSQIFLPNIPHIALLEIARDMEPSVQKKAEFSISFLDANAIFADFAGGRSL